VGPFDFKVGQWFKRGVVNFDFLNKLPEVNLLVAGEVGIDEYIWGDTRRISPEAPVPVIEVESQNATLGLAANVAQNIVSLGAKATLVSVRGQDADGLRLSDMLAQAGILSTVLVEDATRPTLRKVRVIAQKQHVVRIDYERSHSLGAGLAKQFQERICDLIPSTDGIIVQDYGKGIWNADTMSFVAQAKAHKKPVFVDPSRLSRVELYQGTTLLTPNLAEAEVMTGEHAMPSKLAGRDDARLLKMATRIRNGAKAEHAIITCGEWGMVSLSAGHTELTRIPTFARDVYDVTGAGDTVIAVLSMMMVLGYPLPRCMQIANAAAGIVVGKIGTATVSPSELKDELERLCEVGLLS